MEIEFNSKPRVCFEVEKVIGVSSDGSYQVQWAPTWVSKFHLVGCEHLIQEFLTQQAEEVNGGGYKLVVGDTSDGSDLISHTSQVNNTMDDDDHERVVHIEQQSEVISWGNGGKNSSYFLSSGDSLNDISDERNQPDELNKDNTSELPGSSNIVVEIEDDDEEEEEDDYKGVSLEQHSLLANLPNCETPNEADIPKRTKEKPQIIYESQLKTMLHDSAIRPEKLRECPVYAKSHRSSSVKRHLRAHSGAKPFVCDICKTSFAHKGALKRHMRVHTGEKPFQCPNCFKAFTRSTNWKHHVSRCSSNGGVG